MSRMVGCFTELPSDYSRVNLEFARSALAAGRAHEAIALLQAALRVESRGPSSL